MSKVRQFESNATGEKFIEYYGGVTRFENVDAFIFYSQHSESFPRLSIAIRKILGDSTASTSCERAFGFAGMVINIRRTALTPERAEKLILSAARHRNKFRSLKRPPFLPTFGVLPPYDNDDASTFDDQHQLHLDDELPLDADDVWDLFNVVEFNEEY